MKEIHVEFADDLAVVLHDEAAAVRELAHHGRVHVPALREGKEFLDVLRLHRERHALLRLGQEYLPRLQAVVFKERAGQFDFRAAADPRHFADGAAEPSRAVVGQRPVQSEVARLDQEFVHLALRDRVADLHGLRRRFMAQLFR